MEQRQSDRKGLARKFFRKVSSLEPYAAPIAVRNSDLTALIEPGMTPFLFCRFLE